MSENINSISARIADIERRMNAHRASVHAASTSSSNPASTSRQKGVTDFAAVLAQAKATTATSSGYPNGRIPDSALQSIGQGQRLLPDAAQAFLAMQADARQAGVTIGVNDSYRSYDEQVAVAKEKGLYGQGGLAAKPGTSDHGRGIAVDLELDTAAQQWMNQNGKQYGFVNNVAGEAWHWTWKR